MKEDYKEYTVFSGHFSVNLESLTLSDNKIQEFPTLALRLIHKLETLHIDRNKIARLDEDAFQGFGEHIKFLWIQENSLVNPIPTCTHCSCAFMLSHFRLSDIPPTAFQDLHSLEWIKLYNNKLTTLHYELMEPVLDTLIHIDLHSEYYQRTIIFAISAELLKVTWVNGKKTKRNVLCKRLFPTVIPN